MNKNILRIRPHIFTFYKILSKMFVIIILPFLQQIFFYPESIWQKLNYTVFNILTIVFLFVVMWFEYKYISYTQTPQMIIFEKGLFRNSKIYLPNGEVTALSITRSFMLWLFNGCRVYSSSSACCKTRRVEILTYNKSAKKITDFSTDKSSRKIIYKSHFFHPLLMSLIQSDVLTGILAVSIIIQKIGDIIDESIANSVEQQIINFPQILISDLTPALAHIAGFVFAGYIFGIIKQLFTNLNFTTLYNHKFIFVYKGFLKKSILCINRNNVNGILIKQNLLMCIVRLNTLSLLYTGIKEDKNSGMYIPLSTDREIKRYLPPVIDNEKLDKKIVPPKNSIKSYILLPVIYLSVIIALCILTYNNFEVSIMSRIVALVLIPFGVLWLWFRIISSEHCGIFYGNKNIEIKYYKHLSFMTALVKKDTISKYVISQNPFQRFFGKCHLTLYICDKKKIKIKVKHLIYKDAVNFVI